MQRTSCRKKQMKIVKLEKDKACGLGMTITCGDTYDTVLHGAFIESIYPDSPADCDGNLTPGDQILCVNGIDVQNDPFLDVVDLIKDSTSPVELVIAKININQNHHTNKLDIVSNIEDEIPESLIKPQTWISSIKNSNDLFASDRCNSNLLEVSNNTRPPVPKPRKKWTEKDKLNLCTNTFHDDVSHLTIKTKNYDQAEEKITTNLKMMDCSIITEHLSKASCNIPDIIASQMKYVESSFLKSQMVPMVVDECLENSNENVLSYNKSHCVHPNLQISHNSNFCFMNIETINTAGVSPGEIFHVVLDKKDGSLGLNIYQSTEPTYSYQRHIYIHSLIPDGAAKMDDRIRPGDKLLEVDGIILESLSYQEVVTTLRESSQVTHLVLEKGNLVFGDSFDDGKELLQNKGFTNLRNCTAGKNALMGWNTNQSISRNNNFKIGTMNTFEANCVHKIVSDENDVQMDTISVLRDKQIDVHSLKCSDGTPSKNSITVSFDAFNWCLNDVKNDKDHGSCQSVVSKNLKNSLSLTSLSSFSTDLLLPVELNETTRFKCAKDLISSGSMPSLNYTYDTPSCQKHSHLPLYQNTYSNYDDSSFLYSFDEGSVGERISSPFTKGMLQNCGEAEKWTVRMTPLIVYRSTPNLSEASDNERKQNSIQGSLYRNKSANCLVTSPDCLIPGMSLSDFNQYQVSEPGSSHIYQLPLVPIRKKKLKKLEDIYNYSNSGNTFEITIPKSSRGLGLSISGGRETLEKDLISQLICIRKLYPLQPAMDCGKLSVGDIILEVNGTNMIGLSNTEALEILRSSTSNVTLKLFRPSKSSVSLFSFCKDQMQSFFSDSAPSSACSSMRREENNSFIDAEEFEITLKKREGSLGFTVSKREENLDDGPPAGIYIKALVREPAVSDGRLHPGDRIVQVNGENVSSMTNAEAIMFLRNAPDTVTLTLFRCSPPISPVWFDDHPLGKPLRWEAIELLNERIKHKNASVLHDKKKIQRKINKGTVEPSASSSECDSGSSSSCSGREHNISNITPHEDICSKGPGLQRNRRPKSLDVLNSTDRKDISEDDDNFHRQASVIGGSAEQNNKKSSNGDSIDGEYSKNGVKALLKWRGSTLPNNDDESTGTLLPSQESESVIVELNFKNDKLHDNKARETDREISQDTENIFGRVPKNFMQMIDVELDRGWHGRLGFSLHDPLSEIKNTSQNVIPFASEVKAVHPGSLAAKDGRIQVGDRLVEVNSESLIDKSATEAIDILRKTRGVIKMAFWRPNTS